MPALFCQVRRRGSTPRIRSVSSKSSGLGRRLQPCFRAFDSLTRLHACVRAELGGGLLSRLVLGSTPSTRASSLSWRTQARPSEGRCRRSTRRRGTDTYPRLGGPEQRATNAFGKVRLFAGVPCGDGATAAREPHKLEISRFDSCAPLPRRCTVQGRSHTAHREGSTPSVATTRG